MPGFQVGALDGPEAGDGRWEWRQFQPFEECPVAGRGRLSGDVQSHGAPGGLPFEPAELGLEAHQSRGKNCLGRTWCTSQQVRLEDQQVSHEQVVLSQPGGEGLGWQ